VAAIVDDLVVLIDELPQNYDWLHEVQRRKEREESVPSDWTLSQTARQADFANLTMTPKAYSRPRPARTAQNQTAETAQPRL
jgi:hypothetical protein